MRKGKEIKITILEVIKKFPEISYCDRPFAPDNWVFVHLNQKIDDQKKENIKESLFDCGVEMVDFVNP